MLREGKAVGKDLRSASEREGKQTLIEEKIRTTSIAIIEHGDIFSCGIAIHLELLILIFP